LPQEHGVQENLVILASSLKCGKDAAAAAEHDKKGFRHECEQPNKRGFRSSLALCEMWTCPLKTNIANTGVRDGDLSLAGKICLQASPQTGINDSPRARFARTRSGLIQEIHYVHIHRDF
jgi:hypothetical protein